MTDPADSKRAGHRSRSPRRRDVSLALCNAEAAVRLWWDRRVYLRKNRVPPKGEEPKVHPDVPDEYVRPQSFIGPSAARPDGTTAWGVETKSSSPTRDRFPYGVWTSLDVVRRDEAEAMRQLEVVQTETLAITERAMLRLGLIEPDYWFALEMWAAGYSHDNIAGHFKVAKYVAKSYIECGLTWIAGCLIVRPDFSAGMEVKPRRAVPGDLFLADPPAPRIVLEGDLGIPRRPRGVDVSP